MNIFLYGMFLFQVDTAPIPLFAPVVNGHVYGGTNSSQEFIFNPQSTYILKGIIDGGASLAPDPQQEFVFSRSQNPGHQFLPGKSFFSSFTIPKPLIYPLRFRTQVKPASNFFVKDTQHDDYGMTPAMVPFIYVFTYPKSQFVANALTNATLLQDGTQIWQFNPAPGDASSYDLHLYAEPVFEDPNHLSVAIDSINKMFDTPLSLEVTADAQQLHKDPQCDEEVDLLDELHSGGSKAGEMANCMSFVLG